MSSYLHYDPRLTVALSGGIYFEQSSYVFFSVWLEIHWPQPQSWYWECASLPVACGFQNRVLDKVCVLHFQNGSLWFLLLWIGAVQLNSSLLTISVIAVLLPGAFQMALQGQPSYSAESTDYNILKTSRGVRVWYVLTCVKLFSYSHPYPGCHHSPFQ